MHKYTQTNGWKPALISNIKFASQFVGNFRTTAQWTGETAQANPNQCSEANGDRKVQDFLCEASFMKRIILYYT